MKKLNNKELTQIPASLKHKTNLLFLFARCCDLTIWSIEKDLKRISPNYTLNIKQRFNQYSETISQARKHFEHFIEPTIISSGAADNFKDYETSRRFANELMRLVMSYYELCCSNNENHEKVFDLLASLENGMGVFTEKDINEFLL